MARAVNYRRWQLDIVRPFIKGTLLEVGGGIGNFTRDLAGIAQKVISIEPNEYCFAQLTEKTKGLRDVLVFRDTVDSLEQKMPVTEHIDSVVLMNVLEHIEHDEAVLAKLKQRLKPGGTITVLVPAGQWAFGSTDQRLGHYRRYDKPYARQLIDSLGMKLEKLRYYNFIGIWAWWWNARFAKRQNQSDAQIKIFDGLIVPVLSRIESVIPPPLGQSLLFVARRT